MLEYGKYECFGMHMLYVCVFCGSCGSSKCCIMHGGRQAQHTKAKDAQQLQALTRPHSMQNHTKKQHKESKHV